MTIGLPELVEQDTGGHLMFPEPIAARKEPYYEALEQAGNRPGSAPIDVSV